MSTYTIVIDQRELAEGIAGTYEPFLGLFKTKIASEMEEVGYQKVDDLLVIKYEQTEDGRFEMNPGRLYNGMDHLPRIYGVIAKMHSAKKLQLGKSIVLVDVLVNIPNGQYLNEPTVGGRVLRHETSGEVFTLMKDTYSAISKQALSVIKSRFINTDRGVFIPEEYLVRFQAGSRFVYQPLSRVFNDPVVATSYSTLITVDEWIEKRKSVKQVIGEVA